MGGELVSEVLILGKVVVVVVVAGAVTGAAVAFD